VVKGIKRTDKLPYMESNASPLQISVFFVRKAGENLTDIHNDTTLILTSDTSKDKDKNAGFTFGDEIGTSLLDNTTLAFTSGSVTQKEIEDLEKTVSEDWKKGDVIAGLYEVREILGEGAFGTVYRVRHRGWNKDLAVKTLKGELTKNKEHKNLFIKECQGWVNLGLHPNIVTCYYVRDLGGLPRLFLEYMEGGNLYKSLKEGNFKKWEEIIDLAIQCLDGLSFAHSKGLIHRDIKPLNCLLTPGGDLKITDFGIASGLEGLSVTGGDERPEFTTTSGGTVGTPAYMPPEQWDRSFGQTGPWSDIYAFGVMLYEMCCGRRPFGTKGDPAMVLKAHHLTVPPPDPQEVNKEIPLHLSEFILKCLKKKPEERFKSTGECREELVKIYETVKGQSYGRAESEEVELLSDSLNNRAVSMVDLGRMEDALTLWQEALKSDPHHIETIYNHSLVLWRKGQITDDRAITLMEEVRKSHEKEWMDEYLLGDRKSVV